MGNVLNYLFVDQFKIVLIIFIIIFDLWHFVIKRFNRTKKSTMNHAKLEKMPREEKIKLDRFTLILNVYKAFVIITGALITIALLWIPFHGIAFTIISRISAVLYILSGVYGIIQIYSKPPRDTMTESDLQILLSAMTLIVVLFNYIGMYELDWQHFFGQFFKLMPCIPKGLSTLRCCEFFGC